MKKILLPFAGPHFPRQLLEFVAKLDASSPALLTAAFLPEMDYARIGGVPALIPSQVALTRIMEEQPVIQANSVRFRRFCEEHDLRFRIHEGAYDFTLPAIKRESRFADLLLVSNSHFFEDFNESQPNEYLTALLKHTECPVLLAPDNATMPEELVFAYDGSEASVFAIKQFIYLFPEFSRLRATLVYIHEDAADGIPDETLIKELCGHRFRKFRTLRLNMHTPRFYDTWLSLLSNPWLIAGSYARSGISMLFHKSFIVSAIRANNIPVFMAHP